MASPLLRTFSQEIAPRIRESFAGQGAVFSTRRSEAETEALENLQQDLASELARTQFQNQQLQAQLTENAAGRQFQAAQASDPFINQQVRLASALNPFQQFEQQQAGAEFQEFLRTAPESNPFFQSALGFTGQSHMGLVTQPGGSSPLASALGAGIGALGAGSLFGGGSGGGSGIGGGGSGLGQTIGAGIGSVFGPAGSAAGGALGNTLGGLFRG